MFTWLAYLASGDVAPMQSVIGSITAQEVMKVSSHCIAINLINTCKISGHALISISYFMACQNFYSLFPYFVALRDQSLLTFKCLYYSSV